MVMAPTAQAADDLVCERAHARVAAIMEDALDSGMYSPVQQQYVTRSFYLESARADCEEPRNLSVRLEKRTIEGFWNIVSDVSGLSLSQVQDRMLRGANIYAIGGPDSEAIRLDLTRWLSRPVIEAQFAEDISASESAELRYRIQRAVHRLMLQPGDGRFVALSERRN